MSLPRYPEYKDSGLDWLGHVPSHWQIKRLRFVADLNPSKSELKELDRESDVSFLPMEAIGDDGSLSLERTRTLAEVETGYTYFRDGDVVVAKITPCFENGKGALMQGLYGGVGFGTTELVVARPRPDQVLGSFLNWLFRSPDFRKEGEASMYGAGGQKRVPDDFVRNFAWAMAPIDEQRAIADFLFQETSKLDALIAEQKKLLVLLAEKRQVTILSAVTKGLDKHARLADSRVEFLGEIPAHWSFGPLKRWCAVIDCKHVTADFVEDGFHVASIREVQSRYVDLSLSKKTTTECYELLIDGGRKPVPGDLLFSRNVTVGAVSQVLESHPMFAVGQDVCLIRRVTDCCDPDFIYFVLNCNCVVHQLDLAMIGATFKRVNVEDVRCLMVPFPPYEEQKQISEYLCSEIEQYDILKANCESVISLLNERKLALISAAVTGKIDVRGLA